MKVWKRTRFEKSEFEIITAIGQLNLKIVLGQFPIQSLINANKLRTFLISELSHTQPNSVLAAPVLISECGGDTQSTAADRIDFKL